MLRKILIANRGEIAVRIIRACAEMGIRSVAIYSDADRFALHVKKADESYCIGSEPLAGYLNVYALVDLAAATGCDAIHPVMAFSLKTPNLPGSAKNVVLFLLALMPMSFIVGYLCPSPRKGKSLIFITKILLLTRCFSCTFNLT